MVIIVYLMVIEVTTLRDLNLLEERGQDQGLKLFEQPLRWAQACTQSGRGYAGPHAGRDATWATRWGLLPGRQRPSTNVGGHHRPVAALKAFWPLRGLGGSWASRGRWISRGWGVGFVVRAKL